jgi:hypothetical protein
LAEKPEGEFALHIGSHIFDPDSFKDGAGYGIRYILFRIEGNSENYSIVHDELTVKTEQQTTYVENGEIVFNGRTVEVWQDLYQDNFWWAKVEIDAFC